MNLGFNVWESEVVNEKTVLSVSICHASKVCLGALVMYQKY